MSRSLLAAVVAALAAMVPAAAWAQGPTPTLAFDQPCYSEGDRIAFSGAGYTPGGEVGLFFRSSGTGGMGRYDATADPAGAIAGDFESPDPGPYIDDEEWSTEMTVAANDRTRLEAGAPPEQAVGAALFTLSRFEVAVEQPNGARPKARKRMRITAVGFTNARGKTLYLHYRRARRTVKTVRLGRLTGDCGDRTRTLPRALPAGMLPGRYQLVFNTSARNPRTAPRLTRTLRLR